MHQLDYDVHVDPANGIDFEISCRDGYRGIRATVRRRTFDDYFGPRVSVLPTAEKLSILRRNLKDLDAIIFAKRSRLTNFDECDEHQYARLEITSADLTALGIAH